MVVITTLFNIQNFKISNIMGNTIEKVATVESLVMPDICVESHGDSTFESENIMSEQDTIAFLKRFNLDI
jgi:hypothetical protein